VRTNRTLAFKKYIILLYYIKISGILRKSEILSNFHVYSSMFNSFSPVIVLLPEDLVPNKCQEIIRGSMPLSDCRKAMKHQLSIFLPQTSNPFEGVTYYQSLTIPCSMLMWPQNMALLRGESVWYIPRFHPDYHRLAEWLSAPAKD
jgi:hypothetical protein